VKQARDDRRARFALAAVPLNRVVLGRCELAVEIRRDVRKDFGAVSIAHASYALQLIAQHAAAHRLYSPSQAGRNNPASAISAILELVECAVLLGGLIQASDWRAPA
jgi:hypothetical protein